MTTSPGTEVIPGLEVIPCYVRSDDLQPSYGLHEASFWFVRSMYPHLKAFSSSTTGSYGLGTSSQNIQKLKGGDTSKRPAKTKTIRRSMK